jgi:hypothetical protein
VTPTLLVGSKLALDDLRHCMTLVLTVSLPSVGQVVEGSTQSSQLPQFLTNNVRSV